MNDYIIAVSICSYQMAAILVQGSLSLACACHYFRMQSRANRVGHTGVVTAKNQTDVLKGCELTVV